MVRATLTPDKTPFEKLAQKRGVDLEAERRRGRGQLARGETIGGIARESRQDTFTRTTPQPTEPKPLEVVKGETPTFEEVTAKSLSTLESLTGGTGVISEATPQQSFAMTPLGQFLQGLGQGSTFSADKQGRDPRSLPEAQQTGLLVGTTAAIISAGQLSKLIGPKTAVEKLAQVGTPGKIDIRHFARLAPEEASRIASQQLISEIIGARGVGATIAVNTLSKAQTINWIAKLSTKTKAALIIGTAVSAIVGSIGSYPFAGFLKEEALQTLGFGTSSALRNNDIAGAETALEAQREALDPDVWNSIMNAVPFTNVLNSLRNFYGAARIKLEIDAQVISDLKIKVETGETDEQVQARISKQIDDDIKRRNDASDARARNITKLRDEAKAKGNAEDDARWARKLIDNAKNKKLADDIADARWAERQETMNNIGTGSDAPIHYRVF